MVSIFCIYRNYHDIEIVFNHKKKMKIFHNRRSGNGGQRPAILDIAYEKRSPSFSFAAFFPDLKQKRYAFTSGLRVFPFAGCRNQSTILRPSGNILQHDRASTAPLSFIITMIYKRDEFFQPIHISFSKQIRYCMYGQHVIHIEYPILFMHAYFSFLFFYFFFCYMKLACQNKFNL